MALSVQQAERLLELQRIRREESREFSNEEKAELESLLQLHREGASTEEERLKNLNDQLIRLNEQKELVEDLKKIGDSLIGIDELRLNNSIKLTEIQKEEEKLAIKKGTLSEEEYQAELRIIAAKRTKLGLEEAGQDAMSKLLKITTGMTEESKLLGERLLNPMAGLTGAMDKLKTVNPAMVIGAVAMNSLQLAVAQDKAISSFNKATGASGKFDNTITGLERSLVTAGVSSQEAADSVQSLFLNVSDFTEMNDTQQQTLGKTVAVLKELGVASEVTAKNIQFATKVLGQSTEEAAALQRELFVFAQDLGVSASQIAGDFQTLAPQIAAMGKNGVDAFKNLEAQSKSTGLAMNELLGIVQKFDRFDSAAESVSRLNALLGGPFLNATELVAETDLSKRFEILKNRLDDAGLSFDQMDYYQRKATASAMGLNEQQLALLMRGRIDLVQAPEKSAAELEALADQTAQFNTLMEELSQIAMALSLSFRPLVSILKSTIEFLSPILENVRALIPAFIAYQIAVRALAFKGISPLIKSFKALMVAEKSTLVIGGMSILIMGIYSLGGAFESLAVGIGVVTAGIYAMSAAEKTSGIGIFFTLLAGLAAAVAHSFAVGNSPSLVEAFMMVAAAIPLMGLALMALMPLLPGLLLFIPPLALGFAALASSLEYLFEDKTVTNLKLISAEIANIVDKINELDTTKAIAVTATTAVAAGASAISGIAAGAMDAIGINVDATTPETAAATAPAVASGPPAEIKLNITIDGESIAGAINNVEVSNYVKGQRSKLYDSIIDAVVGSQLVSS